ncbi:acetyl-CoA synthetase-like protein [Cadophora sp. DSE1049]|nr:acetyl-CoA synthetase-like protein [Cadophora sp. DSE1049]
MDIVSWTFANPPPDEDKPLYIDPSNPLRSLSFFETRKLVRQLIAGFKAHSIEQNSCICVVSFNDINYTPIYLSILGSNLRFTGANPGYTTRELRHHLRITGARYILTSLKSLSVSLAAAEECNIPLNNIFVLNFAGEDIPLAQQSWEKLLCHGEREWVSGDDGEMRDATAAAAAAYVSTSGTSGLPKAAVIGHGYLISQGKVVEDLVRSRMQINGRRGRESDVSGGVESLIALPPFHVFTMPLQHAVPLRTGYPAYIMPRFEEATFVSAIETFAITHTIVVPPIMMTLSNHNRGELNTLETVFVGGSCASEGMQRKLYGALSEEARIVQVYGMTETGWATTWSRAERDASGSVGQPIDGTRLRAVEKSGAAIEKDNTTGEIQIFTPYAMAGYLSNITATAEARTSNGWIRTGDVGYVQDGNWYVIDRTKDLIKVRGWQVSPAEIEAALLEHPGIQDAGVIASPANDGCGEVPLAFVVKSGSSETNEHDVKEFLGTRLARYKNVEEVEFVDFIPRNPTGKILRRVLRDGRDERERTKGQLAAVEYRSALLELDAYQRSRNSVSMSRSGTLVGGKTESVVSEVEVGGVPANTGRKRKYCPASKFMHWRKLRCASKAGNRVAAENVPGK